MCWHMAHIYRQQEVSILKWLVTDVLTHVVFMYQLLFLMICFILATFAEDRKATIHDIGILMKHTYTHTHIYIIYIYVVPVVRGLSWLLSSFLCLVSSPQFSLIAFSINSPTPIFCCFSPYTYIYIYNVGVCARS